MYLHNTYIDVGLPTLPAVTIYDDAPPQHPVGPPRSSFSLVVPLVSF